MVVYLVSLRCIAVLVSHLRGLCSATQFGRLSVKWSAMKGNVHYAEAPMYKRICWEVLKYQTVKERTLEQFTMPALVAKSMAVGVDG